MVQILDCTLRDGGYVNSWKFGEKAIKNIISGLCSAEVDFIECGYLADTEEHYEKGYTKFKDELGIKETLQLTLKNESIVAMIDFGKYNVEDLIGEKNSCLTGIRVAFHKKDLFRIERDCKIIKEKGYKLFLQPMLTACYSDDELIQLIKLANEIEPYALYVVDSFGALRENDLRRMLYLIDHNLEKSIKLGFHSHNNLQLAYSNAKIVADFQTNRCKIIDSSIFGMGRGAGNLNTELFVEYLNDNYNSNYKIKPLLQIMDSTIKPVYDEKYWGYSLAYYISAIYNCHPNYATYLASKNSLLASDIENIISLLDEEEKENYIEEYVEKLFEQYMSKHDTKHSDWSTLENVLCGKEVLIIGPGKSALETQADVLSLIQKQKIIIISINHICAYLKERLDYVFVSNKRRFQQLPQEIYDRLIATTNIDNDDIKYKVAYEKLVNTEEAVKDNAGIILLNMLLKMGVKKVYVTGIDGYKFDWDENYYDKDLRMQTSKEILQKINCGMRKMINEYRKEIEIHFLKIPLFMENDTQ